MRTFAEYDSRDIFEWDHDHFGEASQSLTDTFSQVGIKRGAEAGRVAFVHAGTHKTGTTSIQVLLAANETRFLDAGVLIPRAGRIGEGSAGHHNIAWELSRDPQFNPAYGDFEALLREIAEAQTPTVCLTSEEFEFLHTDQSAMSRLRTGLARVGYETRIVLYFRPQADYLESLYATIVQHWDVDFDEFFETITSDGIFGCSRFDYQRLANAFATVFGKEQLIVRKYDANAPATTLLREFVATISGAIDFNLLAQPAKLNSMSSFAVVLRARAQRLGYVVSDDIRGDHIFDPLNLMDIIHIIVRFAFSNLQLRKRYGVSVACASQNIVLREMVNAVFGGSASERRKRLIRTPRSSIEIADAVA